MGMCNYCQYESLRKTLEKKGQTTSLKKVKKGPLKGWMQVFIDDKKSEIYYMSIGKSCEC